MRSAHWIAAIFFASALTALPGAGAIAGGDEKPTPLGKFGGYTTQREIERTFLHHMELQQHKNNVSGTCRSDALPSADYRVTSIRGARIGDKLTLKDADVLEIKGEAGFGRGRWITQRAINLKLGKYGELEGDWVGVGPDEGYDGTMTLIRMDYNILIERKRRSDGLVISLLSVNGAQLGEVYENAEKLIPAGSYEGRKRTTSSKPFVQGSGGRLEKSGDFLLEVIGVPRRAEVFIHPGSTPEQSEYSILAGAPKVVGEAVYAPDVLKELRLHFYGEEAFKDRMDPAIYVEKEKNIKIEVREAYQRLRNPISSEEPSNLSSPLAEKESAAEPSATPEPPAAPRGGGGTTLWIVAALGGILFFAFVALVALVGLSWWQSRIRPAPPSS